MQQHYSPFQKSVRCIAKCVRTCEHQELDIALKYTTTSEFGLEDYIEKFGRNPIDFACTCEIKPLHTSVVVTFGHLE